MVFRSQEGIYLIFIGLDLSMRGGIESVFSDYGELIMNLVMLLATVEICNFWGCSWLESAIAFLQEFATKVMA